MQRTLSFKNITSDTVKPLFNSPANMFQVMPDGNIITYLFQPYLTIYDAATGLIINRAYNPSAPLQGFADLKFIESGDIVTIDSLGNSIDVWDSKTLTKKLRILEAKGPSHFDVYNSKVVSLNRQKTISLYDLTSGLKLDEFGIMHDFNGIFFGEKGDIFLWDKRYLYTLRNNSMDVISMKDKDIHFVTKLQNNKLAICLFYEISLYDTETGLFCYTYLSANRTTALAIFSNGDIATCGSKGIEIKYHDDNNIVLLEGVPYTVSTVIRPTPNGKLYLSNGINRVFFEIDLKLLAKKAMGHKNYCTVYRDKLGLFEKTIVGEQVLSMANHQLKYKSKIP